MNRYEEEYLLNKEMLDKEGKTNRFDFVLQYLEAGDRILEVGCANGNLAKYIPENISYFGIDISERAIEDAIKSYPKMFFMNTDILEFDAVSPSYDKIISIETLEHVDDLPIVL